MEFTGILAEIAEATSPDTVARIIEGAGGRRISIPCVKTVERAPDDYWFVALVGREAALVIAQMFACCWVDIPTGYRLMCLKRRQHIHAMFAEGLSANVIAQRAGCHVRTVHRERARLAKRKAQAKLRARSKGEE